MDGYWRGTAIRDRIAGLVGIAALFVAIRFLIGAAAPARLAGNEARNVGGEWGISYPLEAAQLVVWRLVRLPPTRPTTKRGAWRGKLWAGHGR